MIAVSKFSGRKCRAGWRFVLVWSGLVVLLTACRSRDVVADAPGWVEDQLRDLSRTPPEREGACRHVQSQHCEGYRANLEEAVLHYRSCNGAILRRGAEIRDGRLRVVLELPSAGGTVLVKGTAEKIGEEWLFVDMDVDIVRR